MPLRRAGLVATFLLLLAAASRGDELSGPDLVVRFPPSARPMAERILSTLPARRERAARWLGLEPRGPVEAILVADHREMAAAAPGAPSWAVAVTEARGTVVLRLDLVDRTRENALELVLAHESVHLALNGVLSRPPRWFEEGLAVHHAGAAYLDLDMTLERYAASGRLPRFADADRLFEGGAAEAALGYELGERAVRTFVRRFGDEAVRRLVRAMSDGASFPDAFAAAGEPLPQFEQRWRAATTPALPSWLLVVAENLDLALLSAGGLLVALGYLRWRIRRGREMASLGGGAWPPE